MRDHADEIKQVQGEKAHMFVSVRPLDRFMLSDGVINDLCQERSYEVSLDAANVFRRKLVVILEVE